MPQHHISVSFQIAVDSQKAFPQPPFLQTTQPQLLQVILRSYLHVLPQNNQHKLSKNRLLKHIHKATRELQIYYSVLLTQACSCNTDEAAQRGFCKSTWLKKAMGSLWQQFSPADTSFLLALWYWLTDGLAPTSSRNYLRFPVLLGKISSARTFTLPVPSNGPSHQ